jgi:hypothetical protein
MATPTPLPGDFSAGQVLTAANMDDLRGAFRILQVVYASTSTSVTNSTTTPVDTGLTATITPQSTSSKVLVFVNQNGGAKGAGNAANALNVQLMRGATNIQNIILSAGYTNSLLELRLATISGMILDSPSTTSPVTYKTQFYNDLNAAAVLVQIATETSSIVLMEVSA